MRAAPLMFQGAPATVGQRPSTCLISPIFCWTWPSTLAALPLASRRGLPTALPAACLMLPVTLLAMPSALSWVLDFMDQPYTPRRFRPMGSCPRGLGRFLAESALASGAPPVIVA